MSAKHANSLEHEAKEERVWDLMAKLDFCMFTTLVEGAMRSRPMSSIVKKDEQKIYFLSDRKGGKDDELDKNSDVCLAYSDGASRFVSVSGRAQTTADRTVVQQLWNPGAQAFWPDGPSDPKIYAIIVQPFAAEYWDGNSGLVAAAKLVWAIATGARPDLGENQKVAL